jgi:alpha-L-fucosidase
VPKPGEVLNITSLGLNAKLLDKKISAVTLLGSDSKLQWEQMAEGLRVVYPNEFSGKFVVAFKIIMKDL